MLGSCRATAACSFGTVSRTVVRSSGQLSMVRWSQAKEMSDCDLINQCIKERNGREKGECHRKKEVASHQAYLQFLFWANNTGWSGFLLGDNPHGLPLPLREKSHGSSHRPKTEYRANDRGHAVARSLSVMKGRYERVHPSLFNVRKPKWTETPNK